MSRKLARGTVVTGKWNRRSYTIERLLGEGANGTVYLVRDGRRYYAMKIGADAIDHQSEVNALKTLDQHIRPHDPFLIEVDDLRIKGGSMPYYIMKYIEGKRIHEYLRTKGREWVYPVGRNLLERLHELHQHGFVFGDLKKENVMVRAYGEVELVDYGGVTPFGQAVRQFTEIYDRGYWGAGSRTAEETYDLFSFAALFLQLMYPDQQVKEPALVLPQNRKASLLLEPLERDRAYAPLFPVFQKMLEGRYSTSREALEAWRKASMRAAERRRSPGPSRTKASRRASASNGANASNGASALDRANGMGRKKLSRVLGGWLIVSLFVFGITVYFIFQ